MAKATLVLSDHLILDGSTVVEVWHDGAMVATVTGFDGPGVRVLSKHPVSTREIPGVVNVVEVKVGEAS